MKTFEQFRAWMKDNQAWNAYLSEYYAFNVEGSPKEKYDQVQGNILQHSFVWKSSQCGLEYWKDLDSKWREFYNNDMKNYELVYTDERLACVKMPKNATPIQIGFVKSALQKECQEITEFEWEDGKLYGCGRKMQLKKL